MKPDSQPKKIYILSPHLDDAVLSATDYGLLKKRQGHQVIVVTLFSSFSQPSHKATTQAPVVTQNGLCHDSQQYVTKSGFTTLVEFETARKKEDAVAMKLLGFEYQQHKLIDGGFRVHTRFPVYSSHKHLFSGVIASSDQKIVRKLTMILSKITDADEVVVPFGLGQHADHLLVRLVAESCFSPQKICYYLDWPYAYNPKNWSWSAFWLSVTHTHFFHFTSSFKKKAVLAYKSQCPILFGTRPLWYPEILMTK